jgi:hypothetical protein
MNAKKPNPETKNNDENKTIETVFTTQTQLILTKMYIIETICNYANVIGEIAYIGSERHNSSDMNRKQ